VLGALDAAPNIVGASLTATALANRLPRKKPMRALPRFLPNPIRRLAPLVLAVLLAAALAVGFSASSAASQEPFACASDAGELSWTNDGAGKYWVYKSTDGVNFSWIGRTLGATMFTDPGPVVGATYQVHYQGLPRINCSTTAEPNGGSGFACFSDAGELSWSDNGAAKYWVYKSTDGVNFSWIGRTLGATTFTDPAPVVGATYQAHFAGFPRVDCTITAEPAALDPFACEVDNGVITWTDDGPRTYWVYRSTDGVNYVWLGRAIGGALTLTDPNPSGTSYQVHYQGLPRIDCTSAVLYGPPPANAGFDYQIGGGYPLPDGVSVVSRDWFGGQPADGAYSICYVNAFQTQDDDPFVDRPDETSNWPSNLILSDEDPNWPGEYLVNVSTDALRTAALAHLAPMMDACASKGYDAIEFDNLDSWTRFDGLPFDMADSVAFATMLTDYTHDLGLASAQKNTTDLIFAGEHTAIGFDFAVAEECGTYEECGAFVLGYGNAVVAIEYTDAGFAWACAGFGAELSIVRRDTNVTQPGSETYTYDAC